MNELIEKFEKILTKEQLDAFAELKQKLNSIDWDNKEKEDRIAKLSESINNLTDVVLKKIAPTDIGNEKKTSEEASSDLKD